MKPPPTKVSPAEAAQQRVRDELFARPRPRIDDFDFGAGTAAVFDDMLARSVPFYAEIQRMVGLLAADFAIPGSRIYDLGCSTCASFLAISSELREEASDVTFVGVDSSAEMLERGRARLEAARFQHPFELVEADVHQDIPISGASVTLLVLTLQFVRPLQRDALLRRVYEGTEPGGCVILVEKVLGSDSTLNRLFIQHYYEFKRRNGYSQLEIAQKREALENVLVPYRLDENRELLTRAGFDSTDVFFRWFNFCGLIAIKGTR